MADELAELRDRIARLEAKDGCLSTFNEYLHYLDGEFVDDVIGVFSEDAELQLMNYPPGSGENPLYKGHKEIRPIYADHRGIKTRHHTSNATVNVHPGSETADLSAYFLTAVIYGLTGGIYEGSLKLIDGKWFITYLRISSSWGWRVPHEDPPFLDNLFGDGTIRGGRPVPYEQYKPKK
ncbi:MAG: SnoaL-like domain-containing protein [Desulfobacterales bacterium]|jgi:hypothetical protein|nr:SnoaL-like domain-containing protein [Desulfobacteraceae bacterium]MBT7697062.1 SnoaL-like domain-containing protein [Desulfobacterales bacterium]